jgi:tetratricopeptide (TPR) repeat protein
MHYRVCTWALLLVLSGWLSAGCGHPARTKAKVHSSAPAPPPKDPDRDRPLEKSAQAHAHYGAAVIHEMNGETEAALDEYYRACLDDPGNETLVLEVTRRFAQNKQLEKALEILSRAAARPNASGLILARLGMVYSQLGKNDEAITASREATKKAPGSLSGYQNLFLIYMQKKQPQDALKALDEAAHQTGLGVEFLVGLSELYVSYGMQVPAQKQAAQEKALAALNRAEKLNSTQPGVRLKLADGFNMLGDSKHAALIYLELLKKLPDVPMIKEQVHAKLADIYLRASDRTNAATQLQAIVRADPTSPIPYYFLGAIALDDKKPAEAIENFSKAILLNPDMEQAYYDLASAQVAVNKPSEALETLAKARRKFPDNFVVQLLSGIAYARQKSYHEAIQHFTAAEVIAKASDPKRLNQAFYFQLGAAYERKGDLEEAEKYFEESLRLAPDFAESLNYLGYMWAEHGVKLEKARELIEKALKIEPKNGAYLDSMAWVLFKLNQPQQALEYMLKAVEHTDEPDPTVFDHLGDIYVALKQPEKAREAYKKALELEPSEQIKKKLDGLR